MCNVRMIRTEPDLVSIPLEKAIYCENCRMVSSSNQQRCGLCGSERITRVTLFVSAPWDPDPVPALALVA
jgi:hypothetical protein